MTDRRLVEVDFPLEQVSLDSVHEKNVRYGHISTLHIWPARRPLAACRAALVATLLPDPGSAEKRKEIYRRLAGEVVETIKTEKRDGKTVERRKRETKGGILHWGRENGPDLDWFREEIRKAHGGRAPKVLDPFAGGGAIPLEAMRLGCEATAIDINPVAWFILKCTLDYPRRLAGKTLPLPEFARRDRDFMTGFLKARGLKGKSLARELAALGHGEDDDEPALIERDPALQADLAWQVRAWGHRVLAKARRKLAGRYPTYAEFQALAPDGKPFENKPLKLLPPNASGETDVAPLNAEFDAAYLKDPRNPRWIAKPTVAYLWARTVRCKGCRAIIPLLKTCWLAKTDNNKRVVLTVAPNADGTGVVFGIEADISPMEGSAAQRREQEKLLGAGTMSRSGAGCPCCSTIMTMEDLRLEGRAGRLGATMTSVVVEGPRSKEYRLPTAEELEVADVSQEELDKLYSDIPLGLPEEAMPSQGALGIRASLYGFDQWSKLFTNRQLLALGTLVREMRGNAEALDDVPKLWREAILSCNAICLDRMADYSSSICSWHNGGEKIGHTFARFALPMVWDYAEVNPLSGTTGNFLGALDWIARVVKHLQESAKDVPDTWALRRSAIEGGIGEFDAIITDPPYYDAIPYSDLMDFFYVWLRRTLHGLSEATDAAFSQPLGPKWNQEENDGELIDDASRFDGDQTLSKQNYEDGMARAFRACHEALKSDGRLVVVFANKSPDAWETLAAALIRAGFVVDGSWPIQTEMQNRQRSLTSAALASSVWLVCRKRQASARPGWDNAVLAEMRDNVVRRLRDFWDAGIRGPDFVWAATGPALEAFSKFPVIKKADEPGAQMTVSEFLREVRRMVVDFVVGRALTDGGDAETVNGLDDVTTYYLLHRGDFGLGEAPVGACILYAISCNLSDRDLSSRLDILARSNKTGPDDDEAEDGEADDSAGSGNKVRLKGWNRRTAKSLGYEGSGGRPIPLIDCAHRLMHLWRTGDEGRVNDYLDVRGLTRDMLFAQLLQALIELSPAASEERSVLESLSNHIAVRGGRSAPRQADLQFGSVP